MYSLYRRKDIIRPNFPMMVGGGKVGMQESLYQFVGRCLSIVVSLPGPPLSVQLGTLHPITAGHIHTHKV